ncbi:MAG: ATPase, partial [Thiothrix lacustris]
QYAVASALVGRAIRARGTPEAATVYGHILNYAKAFPLKEMGVMLVSDMLRAVGDEIFGIPAFAQWAHSIGDIMLYD